MYKLIYIGERDTFWQNEDIIMEFIMVDSDNVIITDFTDITIKGALCVDYGTSIEVDNDVKGGITINDRVIIVHFPRANTVDLCQGFYRLEIEAEINSNHYTIFYTDNIKIKAENIDW
ncbi:MAG: hypothetical protein JW924_03365 [Fusobacteriaceae bacterium]|nr:hypothetical protein [Fusobacteriaceae bacterium]